MTDVTPFSGFATPQQNYSKLPHELINALPHIETLAEMKVILYILRHTWGFSEYDKPKRITLDEFEHGRKLKDGNRMDGGVGMTKPSIVDGLKRAVAHGFIAATEDASDKARVKKFYVLNMLVSNSLTPDVKELNTGCKEVEQRTEKDTIERNTDTSLADKPQGAPPQPEDDPHYMAVQELVLTGIAANELEAGQMLLDGTYALPPSEDEVMAGLCIDNADPPTPPAKKEKAPRPRDEMFDTIAKTLFNADIDDKAALKAIGGRVGKVKKTLVEMDVIVPEFINACLHYERANPDISLPRDPEKVASMVIDYRAKKAKQAERPPLIAPDAEFVAPSLTPTVTYGGAA
jgi:hypothetical protein